MKPGVLITLGRLPKALELARALAGAGCRVHVAEPFSRHVCKPSRAVAASHVTAAPNADPDGYRRDLLRIIAENDIGLVVPVSEEALHAATIAPLLPAGVRLYSPPFATLARLHDKLEFVRLCESLRLPVPATVLQSSPDAAAFRRSRDFIAKPRNSCSGIGVTLHRRGDDGPPAQDGLLLQERLEGRHVSTFTIAHEGREHATVAYEGTVFAGTVAVCFRRVDDEPAVHAWVGDFVAQTRHSGFVSFDFIVAQGREPMAIECNPRITSGIHFVDPAGLARAVLSPSEAGPAALKPGMRFQQGYSTLTEAYAAFLRPREFARRMGEMFRARDVVWSSGDPLPFLLMTPMSWDILAPAIAGRMSMAEAAMRDIAWFADAAPEISPAEVREAPHDAA